MVEGHVRHEGADTETKELLKLAESPPVVKLLDLILILAIKAGASEVRLERSAEGIKVLERVDGALREMKPPPPPQLALALTSRAKLITGLDMIARGTSQEGRANLTVGGRSVEVRVSAVRNVLGDSVVMHLHPR